MKECWSLPAISRGPQPKPYAARNLTLNPTPYTRRVNQRAEGRRNGALLALTRVTPSTPFLVKPRHGNRQDPPPGEVTPATPNINHKYTPRAPWRQARPPRLSERFDSRVQESGS